MKVYAVVMKCRDNFYPDYQVEDDCVYLKEEDAWRKLEELRGEIRWADFEIYDFEVKE